MHTCLNEGGFEAPNFIRDVGRRDAVAPDVVKIVANDMNLAAGNSRRDARSFKPNFLSRVLLVHPTARLLGMSTRESFWNQSSLKRALINSSSSSMALPASGPSQRIRSLDPCPAASIIKPMILLPFTSSPSFATQISER